MTAEEPKVDAAHRLSADWVSTLPATAAMLVGSSYALGFLIVAISRSRIGILQSEWLKPNLVLVGAMFIVLTAIPAVAGLRRFRFFGLQTDGPHWQVKPEHNSYARVVSAVWFYPTCVALTVPCGLLLYRDRATFVSSMNGSAPYLFAAGVVGALLAVLAVRRWFDRAPLVWTIVALAESVLWFVAMAFWLDRPQFVLSVWFLACGFGAAFVAWLANGKESPRLRAWEEQAILLLALIFYYAVFVYPRIENAFGGGAPRKVIIYFESSPARSLNGTVEANLVDETSEGYYIVTGPSEDQTAYFVPRSSVSVVKFLSRRQE